VAAVGGSTNAVLHLLAIAGRLGIDLTLDDFDQFAGADAARRTGSSAQIWLIVLAEAVLHDAISARVRAQPTR